MRCRTFLLTFCLVLLVGCQVSPAKDETSPDYMVPVGSILILHHAIELPSGRSRALIRAGRLVDIIEFSDMFFPHCILDIDKKSDASRVIKAGEFRIKSVIRRQKASVYNNLVLLGGAVADAGGNGFIDYIHATEMDLSSSAHPEGVKLICQVLGGVLTEPLNIKTIRNTLGRIASLKLVDAP